MKNIDKNMKNYLLLTIFILLNIVSAYAQNKYQDENGKLTRLSEYPYSNVLEYLHNPDTIIFCRYIPRVYDEKDAPDVINLFIYSSNNQWWAASLIINMKNRREYYWELTKPMWLYDMDLSEIMNDVIAELDSVHYSDYIMLKTNTWVYVKYGKVTTKSLIGNFSNFLIDDAPKFSHLFMASFLGSYNNIIVKAFKEKNDRIWETKPLRKRNKGKMFRRKER